MRGRAAETGVCKHFLKKRKPARWKLPFREESKAPSRYDKTGKHKRHQDARSEQKRPVWIEPFVFTLESEAFIYIPTEVTELFCSGQLFIHLIDHFEVENSGRETAN